MVKLIELKCPSCNADLTAKEGRDHLFCEYCGTKILLNNENEHIYRHIDEAKVKQAETERIVRVKQIEMEEKQRELDQKKFSLKLKVLVIALAILFGLPLLAQACILLVSFFMLY